jgi:HAD superfamily hydrolase (TIGR01509 family)
MSLEALIFDFDGTVADTEETHRQAFNYAFLRLELPWDWSRPLYRELLSTSGGKERIARFITMLRVPESEKARLARLVPAIHRIKAALYVELIADGRCPLRPGVERLFAEAREAGVRLAIAATTASANVHALLGRHLGAGAARAFHTIVSGDLVQRKKPAPDIYHLALATLGLPSERCIAFEDSPNGLRAAKAANLFTVVTPSQWTAGEDFAGADLVLSSLGDAEHPLSSEEGALTGIPCLPLSRLEALCAASARERAKPAAAALLRPIGAGNAGGAPGGSGHPDLRS